MIKKLLLCVVLVIAMLSSASAESYMWAEHESNASLINGQADYSQARFSQIYVTVSNSDVQFTEEIANLPGTLTLSGGSYSFWDGKKMQTVSGTSHTFKLGSTYGLWGYELYRDDGYRTRLCLGADGGLNGVNVSWSVPDMPSLSGQAVFPDYRTTQEQLNTFVPYIEFTRSGSQVTGLTWRVVKPSDTSTPVPQGFNMEFQVENVCIDGWDSVFGSEWIDIPAGDTPEGSLTFDEPIDESEIWFVEVNLSTYEDNNQEVYSWKFTNRDDPQMRLFVMHESEAQLINGKADYSKTSFYGLQFTVESDYPNTFLAEAKHFTNEGRITISGGGYSVRDDESEKIIDTVASGTSKTFSLNMYRERHIDNSWLEYTLCDEGLNVVELAGGAETGLNGKTVSWTFPDELNMNGSGVIPSFKSVKEQLAECVPYIDVVSSDGNITAINYKLIKATDSSTVTPSYRTDFRISIMHSDGSTSRSSWYTNTAGGTWTLDDPEAFSDVSYILVLMHSYEDADNMLSYQWDFAPVSASKASNDSGGGGGGGCSTGFTAATLILTASIFLFKRH